MHPFTKNFLKIFWHQKFGATLPEYGFIVAMIVVLLLGAVTFFGYNVEERFKITDFALTHGKDLKTLQEQNFFSGNPEDAPYPVLWGGGDYAVVTSGTSVSPTIRSGTEEGDLLIAFITHRANLTPPPGWQNRSTEEVYNNANTQRLSVLTKSYSAADSNQVTFTQASAQRMIGQIITLKGRDLDIRSIDNTKGSSLQRIGTAITAAQDYTLVLNATTTPTVASNNQPQDLASVFPSNIHYLLSPQATQGNRMSIAAAWGRHEGDTVIAPTFLLDGVTGDWTVTTLTVN